MKKYFITLAIIGIISCNREKTAVTDDMPLQQRKALIEKQIDSLNKLLTGIDKQLNNGENKEIPYIEAIPVKEQAFDHYIELQGNIDTDGNVMLVPQVPGSVVKIYKNEGDRVHKGEVVLRLDDKVIRNQISEVQTQYDLAKTAYERQKRLWDQKIGSEMAFLQTKTKKEALSKKLTTLQSQLRKFKVRAPLSGTLDDLMIKEGEMAGPQRPVARIVNLDKVYMQADVSEKYLPQIKKGTPVIIEFPELQKQLQAKISYTGNFIHPNNRTFKIRIDLSNRKGELKPNLTGNIKIKDFHTDKSVVLPLSLIQEDRQGDNYVFLLEPDKDEDNIYTVQKRILQLGATYKGNAVISKGLKKGDLIAGMAARGLSVGDKVKIKDSAKAGSKTQDTLKENQ